MEAIPYIERLLNTLESGEVRRYHSAPSVPVQSLAQHVYGVACIATYIIGRSPSAALLAACLLHDQDELFTGDVPFTIKRDHPDLKERYLQIGAEASRCALMQFEGPALDATETAVLKIADTLDGLLWCTRNERPGGPIRPRWAESYLIARQKFKDRLMPVQLERADLFFQTCGGRI